MRKLIRVTKRDIRDGKRKSPSSCPVALACKRELKGELGEFLSVEADCISATDGDFTTPTSVFNFIKRFDNGKPVKPFNFYLKD